MSRPARRMLTIEDAADYCGLSVNSFRAHIRIEPVNFGRSLSTKALADPRDNRRQPLQQQPA